MSSEVLQSLLMALCSRTIPESGWSGDLGTLWIAIDNIYRYILLYRDNIDKPILVYPRQMPCLLYYLSSFRLLIIINSIFLLHAMVLRDTAGNVFRISPGRSKGTMTASKDWTQSWCMQGKLSLLYYLSHSVFQILRYFLSKVVGPERLYCG